MKPITSLKQPTVSNRAKAKTSYVSSGIVRHQPKETNTTMSNLKGRGTSLEKRTITVGAGALVGSPRTTSDPKNSIS